MQTIWKIIGTGFGAGYSPVAPGTAGSILAVLVVWFLPEFDPLWLIAVIVLFTAAGIPAGNALEKVWGKDPSKIVVDEMIGMWIALLWIPKHWILYLTAFILFRLFDIVKPYPADKLQDLHGGAGVIADDIIAGIYALIMVHIATYWKFHLLF